VERFPTPKAILDTDEPSSDRLIQEGWPLLRRLSFFFRLGGPQCRDLNWACSSRDVPFARFLQENGYCLEKHRLDVPLDSQVPLAYFVGVIRLENP
jgi:hypothetical protein